MRGLPGKILILALGLLILGSLSGCAVGGWPYSTPTATPAPPTATATAAPTSTPIAKPSSIDETGAR